MVRKLVGLFRLILQTAFLIWAVLLLAGQMPSGGGRELFYALHLFPVSAQLLSSTVPVWWPATVVLLLITLRYGRLYCSF